MSDGACDRCGEASFGPVKVLVLERVVQDRVTCLQCAALVDGALRRFWEGAPEPSPSPAPPSLPAKRKYTMSPKAKAQRSHAGKANGIERNDGTESNEIGERNRTKSNEISFTGGKGGASSSFEKLNNYRDLEAEEAARARGTKSNEIGTKSANEIERNGERNRTKSPALLRALPPPPRPSIEGLPPPSELKRPNSAAERKAIADLLEEMQTARQLANPAPFAPLPLTDTERPYFDDFALRALALTTQDTGPIIDGYEGWLAEDWPQENCGPWRTWLRQWPGKMRLRPATPPPVRRVQQWAGVAQETLDALEAALERLAEDGLTYAASQLALLRPSGTPDAIELHAKDPFFLEFCREHWAESLPPNVRLAAAKQEAAS